MTTISVPDMMCENCVRRISEALGAAKLQFEVNLGEKLVRVDGGEQSVQTALSELEDLGFSPQVR